MRCVCVCGVHFGRAHHFAECGKQAIKNDGGITNVEIDVCVCVCVCCWLNILKKGGSSRKIIL